MDTDQTRIEPGSREYNRLVERLKPIYYSVETEAYNRILTALCTKDIDSIVDVLLSNNKVRKEAIIEIINAQGDLRETQYELEIEKKRNENLQIQLSESHQREQDLLAEIRRCIKPPAKKDCLTDEAVLSEYEKAKSLRAVAKALGCSHNTVKARLIKMGCIEK